MDPVIVTQGLSRRFGENVAVRDLSLTVQAGQVFGFLGPNGAGKTTTVRLLNGILEPSSGSARVLGMDPAVDGAGVRHRTGVLTENPSLYEALTARENLGFVGDVYGVPADELPQRIDRLLERFGLLARGNDKAGTYSRGMKQRLAIARALLAEPDVLFLDEPTSGLDPAAARDVMELIEELARVEGRTIFMCTHNLVEAERLCNVVGVIDRGVLRAVGSPGDLARQLWHGAVLEIDLRAAPPEPVRQAILGVPAVQGLEVNEGLVVVRVLDDDATPTIVEAVVRAGGHIHSVRPRGHDLEDVYFALQGEQPAAGTEEA